MGQWLPLENLGSSYLGSRRPVRIGGRGKRLESSAQPRRRRPPFPLLHQRAETPRLFLRHLQQAVAGPLAPDGHVLADAGVVPQDFQEIPGMELPHLAGRQEDRQRTEGSGDVEAADRLGRGVSH